MEKHFLEDLIDRLRGGRESARMELWRQYEPHVVRMVRRHLRPGTAPSALQRRIQAAAKDVAGDGTAQQLLDQDGLDRRVAWRFCQSLLEPVSMDLSTGLPRRETVRI